MSSRDVRFPIYMIGVWLRQNSSVLPGQNPRDGVGVAEGQGIHSGVKNVQCERGSYAFPELLSLDWLSRLCVHCEHISLNHLYDNHGNPN